MIRRKNPPPQWNPAHLAHEVSFLPGMSVFLGLSSATVVLTAFLLVAGGFLPFVKFTLLAGAVPATLAIVVCVLRWPVFLVYLVFVGVILDQWEGLGFLGIPYLTLTKVWVLLAGAALVARAVAGRGMPPSLLFPTAVLAHLPFSFVCAISALAFAYSFRGAIQWLVAPVFLPIMAILLVQFIPGRESAVRLLKAFVIFSFFPMGVAFLEAILGRNLAGPPENVSLGSMDIFRVAGNFENPNDLVVLFLFCVPLLLAWAFQTPRWSSRLILLLGAFFQCLALLKTYSRSGYISMGFAFFALFLFGRGRLRLVGFLACLMGLATMFYTPDVRDRMLTLVGIRAESAGVSQAIASVNFRKTLAIAAWSEFVDHPFLGIGFGNFGARVKAHSTLILGTTAENTYLQIMAEMGMAGISAFLLFLFFVWKTIETGLGRNRGDPLVEPLFVALAAGFFGFAANSLFDTNLADNLPWVLLAVTVHLIPPEGSRS